MYIFIFVVVVIESVFDDMSWVILFGCLEIVVILGFIVCIMVVYFLKLDVGLMKMIMCDIFDVEFLNDLLDFFFGSEYIFEDDELDESDLEVSEFLLIEKKRKFL